MNNTSQNNKLSKPLLIIVVLLALFVIGQIIYVSIKKKPVEDIPTSYSGENITEVPPLPAEFKDPFKIQDTYATVPPIADSFNSIDFNNIKNQMPESMRGPDGAGFTGRVLNVVYPSSKNNNTLGIRLESSLEASTGKQVWYVYPDSVLSKITVKGNTITENLTFQDILPDHTLTISESFDTSKEYPDAISTVTITNSSL